MTSPAAVVFSIAVIVVTVQFALWRSLRNEASDAPAFLRSGRSLIPAGSIAVAAASLMILIA